MEHTARAKKIQKFLLDQQLPKVGPVGSKSEAVTTVDHVSQVALESCRCRHLQEYLPDVLDLTVCKATQAPRGWVPANPVHSLHLTSQLDEPSSSLLSSLSTAKTTPSMLYGEEHQRRDALYTKGVVEYYAPLDGYSATLHEDTVSERNAHLAAKLKASMAAAAAAEATVAPNLDIPIIQSPPQDSDVPSDGKIAVPSSATSSSTPPVNKPGVPEVPKSSQDVAPVMSGQDGTVDTTTAAPTPIPSTSSGPVEMQTTESKTEETKTPEPMEVTSENKSSTPPDAAATTTPSDAKSSEEPPKTETSEAASDTAPKDDAADAKEAPPEAANPAATKDTAAKVDEEDPVSPNDAKSSAAEAKSDSDAVAKEENDKDAKDDKAPASSTKETPSTEKPSTTETDTKTADVEMKPPPEEEETTKESTTAASAAPTTDAPVESATADPAPASEEQASTTAPPVSEEEKPSTEPAATTSAEKPTTTITTTTTTTADVEMKPASDVVSSAGASSTAASLVVVKTETKEEPSPFLLSETDYSRLRVKEDRLRLLRRSLASPRVNIKKKSDTKKKRKRDSETFKTVGLPGWRPSASTQLSPEQEDEWNEAAKTARKQVELWMDYYRLCRQSYWDERQLKQHHTQESFYLPTDVNEQMRCCQVCSSRKAEDPTWDVHSPKLSRRQLTGDSLMQCLECDFIGCSPQSIAPRSRQHILQHMLISGHQLAVTCGERAQLFCFRCGDFVYHEVFEKERKRIDCCHQLEFMGWKSDPVQRSFDPLQFMRTREHGIVWRGLVATYPHLVPKEHPTATQLTARRQDLFQGRVHEGWLLTKPSALNFAASQHLLSDDLKYEIVAPVGMYNLGNTCFKSAILQCLIHCQPLQDYFLRNIGHNHMSCKLYRKRLQMSKKKKIAANILGTADNKQSAKKESVCIACEMDRLFLSYYGHTVGKDIFAAIQEASRLKRVVNQEERIDPDEIEKGDPLIISDFLTASWKSGGMDHLAGYEQRDAHEFLSSFLELLGKHTFQYRERVFDSITKVKNDNALVPRPSDKKDDIVKQLFEGTLRSVLVCEECGGKRSMKEEFLNISLTLSEEVERMQAENGDVQLQKLSVETCLEHFVLPEKLGDGVHCPNCKKKTPTKKQHTFSKLPKVLCLHLKRFDAARNRKIDQFVSFPSRGLNMGKLLSHWCEVSRLPSEEGGSSTAEPRVLYDLYATVNHQGNMQSGHYVTHIKVKDQWYHCNDAHIGKTGDGDGEEEVLKDDGAYLLFYTRR